MKIKKIAQTTPVSGEIVDSLEGSAVDKAPSIRAVNAVLDNLSPADIELGTVLWENDTGSNDTITLNETVANYDSIEIFYRSNDRHYSSVKVDNPNNKIVSLQANISTTESSTHVLYEKFKGIRIVDNQITNTDYTEICFRGTSVDSNQNSNMIYITKVIGYKNTIPAIVQKEEEIYSTTEQRIGTWINGKPIYRRVLTPFITIATDAKIIVNIPNFDTLINISGSYTIESDNHIPPNYFMTSSYHVNTWISKYGIVDNSANVYYSCAGYVDYTAYIVIEYTKTTD